VVFKASPRNKRLTPAVIEAKVRSGKGFVRVRGAVDARVLTSG
jgi:hypothetical protein